MQESAIVTNPDHNGMRVDKFIAQELRLFPRSQFEQRNLRISVNGKLEKYSKKIHEGDVVELTFDEPKPINVLAEQMDLDILYEDANILVLNKPQSVVVHPAHGHYSQTLVQGLLYYLKGLAEQFPDEIIRPGIVHRLDKDTSGLIVAAKNPAAHEFLALQFREKRVRKKYLAIIKGRLEKQQGVIRLNIKRDEKNRKRFTWALDRVGKTAITEYRVIRRFKFHSFVLLKPTTGRTHQLRVHMRALGSPILGDPIYSRVDKRFTDVGLMLHAHQLTLKVPGKEKPTTFHSPLPERFRTVLKKLYLEIDL